MIVEMAQIEVKPGSEAAFEAAVGQAQAIFGRAKGCHGLTLQRSIEFPKRYRLFIQWDTLEDHTVGFRGSADFGEWRKLVSDHFDGMPVVEHLNQVALG